ncbi:MAG: NAD(P)-dependent oxidoreductase [Rhizobiales bacterium]|nr:NAD(P)-dependent oxidoreductase [Hyphomicrobiales bacterium]MBN9009381.1 NAD(P)-dependent oxidoreductase [Hyphomicrobiales bacterium]
MHRALHGSVRRSKRRLAAAAGGAYRQIGGAGLSPGCLRGTGKDRIVSAAEKIGFIGVGLMGHGMAKNMVEKGYPLTILAHRNRKPVEDLVSRGAREAASAKEVGENSTIVFLCVTGSREVEAVVRGLKEGLKPGSVIVDCSTADPNSTVALAAELAPLGIDYADAPLGGTPVQAEEGKLSAMVGASDAVFARLKPVIETWAGKVVHTGGVGDGHRMKLLNNFLSLGYAALYAEALALAAKVGITAERFDSVIRGGRMDCGFYQTFMGYMIDGDREAHKFTLSNAFKDMRYLESMADAAGMVNPVGNAVKNTFALAVHDGGDGGENYVPHLPEYIGRANGVALTPRKLKGQA